MPNPAGSAAARIVTAERLQRFVPGLAGADDWSAALNIALDRFAINSPARCAAFLANVAYESNDFRRLEENLHYSPERLVQVWPNRFPDVASAQPYAHDPQKLANFVYANRLGNGDFASADGWRFRGRGLLQITGRNNYRDVGTAIALDLQQDPELLMMPGPAALSAAFFWESRGLNQLADTGTDDDFSILVRRINGGVTGLQQRRAYWMRAKLIFVAS